jgi:hypothetical protein
LCAEVMLSLAPAPLDPARCHADHRGEWRSVHARRCDESRFKKRRPKKTPVVARLAGCGCF